MAFPLHPSPGIKKTSWKVASRRSAFHSEAKKTSDLGRTPQDGAAERRGGANPHRLEDYDGSRTGVGAA